METNRKTNSGLIFVLLLYLFLLLLAFGAPLTASASARLNKSEVQISQGKSTKLKIKGSKKSAKWTSSNKKIATVDQKGVVKGKSGGKAVIKAKIGKKTYKCNVTVLCKKHSFTNEYTAPIKGKHGRKAVVCKKCGYEKSSEDVYYQPTEAQAYADIMAEQSKYPHGGKQPGGYDIATMTSEGLAPFTISRFGFLLQEAAFGEDRGFDKKLHNLYDAKVGDVIFDTESSGGTKYRYAYTVLSVNGNIIDCATARDGTFNWKHKIKITSPATFIEPVIWQDDAGNITNYEWPENETSCPQSYLLEISSYWE